jgi:hypothetical protein
VGYDFEQEQLRKVFRAYQLRDDCSSCFTWPRPGAELRTLSTQVLAQCGACCGMSCGRHWRVSFLKLLGCENIKDQLQFLGFFDYGSTRAYNGNITRQDGRAVSTETLASVGPGLRYTVNTWLSVRADYGFQLNDAGNDRRDSRWHVGVIVSY